MPHNQHPSNQATAGAAMPSISEDEHSEQVDEPPESSKTFKKATLPPVYSRRQSLITQALHTEPESGSQDLASPAGPKQAASISSTCSAFSTRSPFDFTSDDGHNSTGTRPSTPGSPRSAPHVDKASFFSIRPAATITTTAAPPSSEQSSTAGSQDVKDASVEPTVEATLGRKRCITFACGGAKKDTAIKDAPVKETEKPVAQLAEPAKRPCMIKFACPFSKDKSSPPASKPTKESTSRFGRHLSPAPSNCKSQSPASSYRRVHRDSDSTIRNASPKMPVQQTSSSTVGNLINRWRRLSTNSNAEKSEKMRCHIFATSDDEVEDWISESTVHRSRLTVDDTLNKENAIRRLAEEVEEEDEDDAEEDLAQDLDDDDEDVEDDEDEDEGFQTDNEEGFADSDDDANGSDDDYDWWTPRKTQQNSPFVAHRFLRPGAHRAASDSSLNSMDDVSPKATSFLDAKPSKKRVRSIAIQTEASDLPDSTDFVCGTLDEDRPLEEAYLTTLKQRQAAKHKAIPQDIDPTFPTSDPELEDDDEEDEVDDEDDVVAPATIKLDHNDFLVHGHPEIAEERGRKGSTQASTPYASPKRLRSPAPLKRMASGRSPAPPNIRAAAAAFHAQHEALRPPASTATKRFKSPAPTKRASPAGSVDGSRTLTINHPFLAESIYEPTHTASLPRSPGPMHQFAVGKCVEEEASDEEVADETGYSRGAIDIVQGLEHKRLRRRQKLYSIQQRTAEKKNKNINHKRPQPGKGAERMRQVGIECAKYRGKRVLSL